MTIKVPEVTAAEETAMENAYLDEACARAREAILDIAGTYRHSPHLDIAKRAKQALRQLAVMAENMLALEAPE